ncbi:MAG TPA: SET domain-containing protein-lysine N-methyltransferase [Steroidobacteraceae bacterium]|nr:SET domain-containing protein-lysine N-methyltransferase [Steroidobacteraceae bacterium]
MATAKAKAKAGKGRSAAKNKWIIVRHSKVHGHGCFARRFIPKGTRIIEYVGERISHKEADRRYEHADVNDNHTFLFIADRRTVIDATTGGNESRFINHSCDGNCESEIEKSRVFVEAIRDIPKGAELGYDYQIGRDRNDPPNVDEIYACRCGAANCRGSMLWPPLKEFRRRQARRRAAASKRAAAKRKSGAPARKGGRARRAGRAA